MDGELPPRDVVGEAKPVAVSDLLIVAASVTALIVTNVAVVRLVDVALDAIHR